MMDAGDPVEFKKKKTKAQLRKEQRTEDLRKLLTVRGNRDFIWRLLEECGVYRTNASPDHGTMAFLEGRRSIGIWLLNEVMTSNAGAYGAMRDEAAEGARDFNKENE